MRSDSWASGGTFLTWTTLDGVPLLLLLLLFDPDVGSSVAEPFMFAVMVVVLLPLFAVMIESLDSDSGSIFTWRRKTTEMIGMNLSVLKHEHTFLEEVVMLLL